MFFTRYSRYRSFWHLFTPLWIKGNVCFLSRPRPERLEVTPKSAIYTRKRDEEHPSHFYMGVPRENRSTDLKREKTGVCAIQDYSYHKDFNVMQHQQWKADALLAVASCISLLRILNSLYYFQTPTLGSRGYFFLIDTDGSRRSRVNEALLGAFFCVNAASVSIRKKYPLEPRVPDPL